MNAGGFSRIKCDVPRAHVARIALASGAENPLDAEVLGELYGALGFVRGTPEVRALVLTHEGPYFSSGGEVASVTTGEGSIGPMSMVLQAIHELGKPTIAAIDGKAHGAGLALALATDLAVAGPRASFAIPEPAAGLWSFHVLAELVPLVGRRRAAGLFLDGQTLDGAAALALGLVNHRVDGSAMEDALERAGRLATLGPVAAAMGLAAMRRAAIADANVNDALQALLDQFVATPEAREAAARASGTAS